MLALPSSTPSARWQTQLACKARPAIVSLQTLRPFGQARKRRAALAFLLGSQLGDAEALIMYLQTICGIHQTNLLTCSNSMKRKSYSGGDHVEDATGRWSVAQLFKKAGPF